jgi:hypothetical protein
MTANNVLLTHTRTTPVCRQRVCRATPVSLVLCRIRAPFFGRSATAVPGTSETAAPRVPRARAGTTVLLRTFLSARSVQRIRSRLRLCTRGTLLPTVLCASYATRRRTRLSRTTMTPREGAWAVENPVSKCARSVLRRRPCSFRRRRASATSACAAVCVISTFTGL